MTYDYAGPSFTTVTGNLAPLVNADPMSGYSVEVNIKQWIAAGASPSKMTLGSSQSPPMHPRLISIES